LVAANGGAEAVLGLAVSGGTWVVGAAEETLAGPLRSVSALFSALNKLMAILLTILFADSGKNVRKTDLAGLSVSTRKSLCLCQINAQKLAIRFAASAFRLLGRSI
jgi:hypothetical protein